MVEVVRRELLTPFGLRTLDRNDPGYRGRYAGNQWDRDGAYHNGTVWPWLIGPFLDGVPERQRPLGRGGGAGAPVAAAVDRPHGAELHRADRRDLRGDEPHRPVGCPAQAWSVAEVLRLAVDIEM